MLGVLLVAGVVSLPAMSSAQRSGDNPSAEREAVRAKKAEVATQVDALEATDAQVGAALDALQANVSGQEALSAEAARAAEEAEKAFAAATAAVTAKSAEIELLRGEIREFAVQAYVHPPADDAMAALDTADPGEAAEKRALLEIQNISDADLFDQLSAAEEDLEVERQLAETAAARAEEKKAAAANRLGQLKTARDQQAAYAAQVEDRLDRALGEAAGLEALDAELSQQIQAQQAELARKAKAAADAAARARASAPSAPRGGGGGGGGGGSSSVTFNGSLSSVSCPSGGSITVASSLADNLQSLLNAASSAGIQLCGSGWRDPQRQADLRIINGCPDVYSAPASSCDVPTARPGQSMHEQGLAVDFTYGGGTVSNGSAADSWLQSNAGSFGLHNLPSEPWHYSTSGG
ncbi:MAG: M15 family metallopeptidase [Acidimicrobiales bacterium]